MNIFKPDHESVNTMMLSKFEQPKLPVSKVIATAETILEALQTENIDLLKEVYLNSNFSAKKLEGIQPLVAGFLNSKYADIVIDKLKDRRENSAFKIDLWDEREEALKKERAENEETKDKELDEEKIQELKKSEQAEREDAEYRTTELLATTLYQTKNNKTREENISNYLIDRFPELATKTLAQIPEEKDRKNPELRQLIKEERIKWWKNMLEKYPFASKSEYHSINSKKFINELRNAYMDELSYIITKILHDELVEKVDGQERIAEDEFFNLYFETIYERLTPIIKELSDIYDRFSYVFIEHRFAQSHQRKEPKSTTTKITKEEEDQLKYNLYQAALDPAYLSKKRLVEQTIVPVLALCNLDKNTLRLYANRIARLHSNHKHFKLEDFPLIRAEHEGKIFDLIEDLGIQVWTENQTPEIIPTSESPESEKEQEKSDSSPDLSSEIKSQIPLDLSLDTESLLQNIIIQLQERNFIIKNPNQLKKQFWEFLKSGDTRESVLAALSNPSIMTAKSPKNNNIYAINLTYKDRLLIIKEGNTRVVDSFHSDHDAYEDRIFAIK